MNRMTRALTALTFVLLPAALAAAQATHTSGVKFDPSQYFPSDSRLWPQADRAILLTDLSKAEPASALHSGDRRKKERWHVIPYETAAFSGHALSVFPETGAPVVSLPLDARGWHAVYIGVGSASNGIDNIDNKVRARLSGDESFKRMTNRQVVDYKNDRRESIEEVFLTVADVTGRSVEFKQVPFVRSTVMYVKLVPVTEADAIAWREQRPDGEVRPVIATIDNHSWVWPYKPRTAADLKETFAGWERSDFSKWWFQVMGADLTGYPTEVGTVPGMETEDFPRWEYKEHVDSMQALFDAGIDPLKVAKEVADEQGAEFHVFIRPGAWKGALSLEEVFDSKFYDEHPEWRAIDIDGTPTYYMSYAYPQVRRHILDVLREALKVNPDGVGYLFVRGMPLMLWEDGFSEPFKSKHGVDPRTLPEDDPRVYAMRAQIMTDFLRETRQMLDEAQREMGRDKPFAISVTGFNTQQDNDRHGLALETWINEGLANDVAVAWFAHHTSFTEENRTTIDMDYYTRITEGKNVGLYPMVIGWKPGTPEAMSKKVAEYYERGVTGISVWDPDQARWPTRHGSDPFDALSLLGHVDYVKRWTEAGVPRPLVTPLTRFGDNHYSRWFPNTGF